MCSEIIAALSQLKREHSIRAIDYYFACFIAKFDRNALVVLVSAATSFEPSKGSSCIHLPSLLSMQTQSTLFHLSIEQHRALLSLIPLKERDIEILHHSNVVGDGRTKTPLVLYKKRLYLYRHWFYETVVITWMKQCYDVQPNTVGESAHTPLVFAIEQYGIRLNERQKVSVSMAVTSPLTVILGGAGSGKTTAVIAILAQYRAMYPKAMIRMVAPTGKAAMRLNTLIREKNILLEEATTIHRLLGASEKQHAFHYNANNLLPVDFVIVDEISMVSTALLARLMLALSTDAKLVLVGDQNQLPAIEVGNISVVFKKMARLPHSARRFEQIKNLVGSPYLDRLSKRVGWQDSVFYLSNNYRLQKGTALSRLAGDILQGQYHRVIDRVLHSPEEIVFYDTKHGLDRFINAMMPYYHTYFKRIRENIKIEALWDILHSFQMLTVVREGLYGTAVLNALIVQKLIERGYITDKKGDWYHGRPVIITKNHHHLLLYNGEIGITFMDQSDVYVMFPAVSGPPRIFPVVVLQDYETAFVITVHKSQGSEYEHVAFVAGHQGAATRELLYTAITRAQKKLCLFSNESMIERAIKQRIKRTSGIYERMLCKKTESPLESSLE